MTRQLLSRSLLVAAAVLVAAGCGGPPSVKDARACLADLKLTVEDTPDTDKQVEEGVFASTDVSKGLTDKLTIALVAVAKTDDAVSTFEKESTQFVTQMGEDGDTKLRVDSGSDGRYVWVVVGAPKSTTYEGAIACVRP